MAGVACVLLCGKVICWCLAAVAITWQKKLCSAPTNRIPISSPAGLVQGTGLVRIGNQTTTPRHKIIAAKNRLTRDWAPGQSVFCILRQVRNKSPVFFRRGCRGKPFFFRKERFPPAHSHTPQHELQFIRLVGGVAELREDGGAPAVVAADAFAEEGDVEHGAAAAG